MGKRVLSFADTVQVICLIVFVAGILWGSIGMSTRRNLHRQWLAVQRNEVFSNVPTPADIESLITLCKEADAMIADLEEDFQLNETVTELPSGIELTGSIQSFLHEYRQLYDAKGIALQDRNLGFTDYVREVVIVFNARNSAVLQAQVALSKLSLTWLANAEPIALVSAKREWFMTEIHSGERVTPEVGHLEPEKSGYRHCIRLHLEFDGYTRSFRAFLNQWVSAGLEQGIRVVALEVGRSERSERDRSSEWMDSPPKSVVPSSRSAQNASPFATYLEPELHLNEEGLAQTKPLIGAVVSRIRITLEKGWEDTDGF